MPSLLIITAQPKLAVELERLGSEQGYRVKTVAEPKAAREWIQMRQYDAIISQTTLSAEEQEVLAGLLWRKNPSASFISLDIEGDYEDRGRTVRFFGGDYIHGPSYATDIRFLLESAKTRKERETESFRILVVEDLDSPRDIICFFLESLGYRDVVGKASALEALEELESEPDKFCCVITDMRMPEVSGQQLIERVRQHPKLQHLPVIVLTAFGSVDTLSECLKAGASGFLLKPPKKDDLQRELTRATKIIAGEMSPRLATHDEAEKVRDHLILKGFS